MRFGPFGYLRLTSEAGRIIGNLPYPLLMIHQGNETFFYDEGSYNTMNFFEFVSDEWVSVWASYHADGLFLNKIPIMRRMKCFTLEKPFVEAAVGVENIFKVLRIDFIWRLTYLDNPNIVKYGIRAKLQFEF